MSRRKGGILLHITSLPGDEGVGTLGKNAFQFVDFLKETGQKMWQILPLGPVGAGDSPYQCFSAFAGNPVLIDLELLVDDGILDKTILEKIPRFIQKRVDFKKVKKWKYEMLGKAFSSYQNKIHEKFQNEYYSFLDEHSWWLNDYALFMAAKNHHGDDVLWTDWEKGFKFRENSALQRVGEQLSVDVDFHKFLQFLFFRQWFALKEYANSNGVEIVGDVPLYVSTDSSDVWTNTDIFLLDDNLIPTEVGGVPPDYFSATGQLWGNPVFNWHRLKERDYDWWMARLHFNLKMFNQVRIDHFRGLESFWSVSAGEETAINGKWVPAFGFEMLAKIKGQIGELPFIAEDLGIITQEVDKLREDFNLPGMKVLQFAFTTDASHDHLPHNSDNNFVAYTGTHDNDTTLGWLNSINGDEKKLAQLYLGKDAGKMLGNAIELIWASVTDRAIISMQDLLGLDSDARMNTPGIAIGNWGWRFQWKQLKQGQKRFLKELTEKYNR
ncbi:MAG: 4-alpha-glucanotransferase [Bacteroidetes bacterium]|nr:4-alpha-glucanotransferase [Bacteroidota bacterium]